MAYKIEALAYLKKRDGSEDWNTNGIVLPTEEQAKAYGKDFCNRACMVFKTFRVIESDEPVNYIFDIENRKLVEA